MLGIIIIFAAAMVPFFGFLIWVAYKLITSDAD